MEINVERKRAPVWPWILAALVLVLAIGWWAFDDGDAETEAVAVVDPMATGAEPVGDAALDRGAGAGTAGTAADGMPQAVTAYATFVESNRLEPGLEHTYTARALTHLGDALRSVSTDAGAAATDGQSRFDETASQIQEHAMSLDHANEVRQAFIAATDTLEAVARQHDASAAQTAVDELRNLATSIRPQQPLLEQSETVERFFARSSEVLQNLAAAS